MTNFAAREQGLSLTNPFGGVYYDRDAGVSDRNAVSRGALLKVRIECRKRDDDLRGQTANLLSRHVALKKIIPGRMHRKIRQAQLSRLIQHRRVLRGSVRADRNAPILARVSLLRRAGRG